MKELLLRLYDKIRRLHGEEGGQDLVEYALIVGLVALAATAGMQTFASHVNTAFSSLATTFNGDV
jgi:pilus assembly protein Flp/PilA